MFYGELQSKIIFALKFTSWQDSVYALDTSAWYQWMIRFSFTLWLTDIGQYKQGIGEGLLLSTWWLAVVVTYLTKSIGNVVCLFNP